MVEYLEDQLRKTEEDIHRGKLEVGLVFLSLWGAVEKLSGWEEIMAKREKKTLRD